MRYALDPVGGETGTAVFRSLGAGGRLVVYGTLSGEPIQVDPRLLISGRKVVEGFWLGHWMRDRSIPASLLLFREIAALIRQGVLASEIGPSFALDEINEAVQPGRGRRPRRQGPAQAPHRVGRVTVQLANWRSQDLRRHPGSWRAPASDHPGEGGQLRASTDSECE